MSRSIVKCRHLMPFGAQCLDQGGVDFRLWAPKAGRVELCLEDAGQERRLGMIPAGQGWHALEVPEAGPASRYRFRPDGGHPVPDPASRFNPGDVHGASEVIDPLAFTWLDSDWRGGPWAKAVIYELHVGTFTPEGTFRAVIGKLAGLVELGVTAIELMPVADFPGRRNWGYDGALPFAPDAVYGRPEDLKALVQAAHRGGLMVLLDVVYNHFGPEGNYLHLYAPDFFTDRHHTPWGAAINYDGENSRTVRDFFIHNALYWLTEYRLDGLRLDAVHAIADDSAKHILTELAEAVHAGPGRERRIHLLLENDDNEAHYLDKDYTAQWNDDIHHVFHVLLTGERDGYYGDYADAPAKHLGRCLAEGFSYQGDASTFRRGEARGEPSRHLPPSAFVSFLQNHDQIGNRAFGERLGTLTHPEALRAALAIMLLAPSPPLLFMGEEFGAQTPFLYFSDFGEDLRVAVREGRRREFARFDRFANPEVRGTIPDPGEESTFLSSKLDWEQASAPAGRFWRGIYRDLLRLRQERLVPLLGNCRAQGSVPIGGRALTASWQSENTRLHLLTNLDAATVTGIERPPGGLIYATPPELEDALAENRMPPWSTAWFLERHP
jgi:maltooligosyltrehalose trehalohydrolase